MRALSHPVFTVLLLSSALLLSGCKSAEERADQYFENAKSLIAEADMDRAIVELRNALNLNSSHKDARRALAELQMERGDEAAAYRQYLRLAEAYPDDLDSRILLSEIAFSAANWDELERHGARAEELAPDNPRVEVITLVRSYRAAIDSSDAPTRRDLAKQADEMLKDRPENVLLHNVLMDNALREQDFTRALAEIDWLIAYEPLNSRNYQERLRVLATINDMDGVEAQLREMIKIFPDDPAHKATLIRFYVSRNDLDAAEGVLRDLVAASPVDDPSPTVQLIQFLAAYRGPEAVRTEVRRAIAEHPDPVPFQVIEASFEFALGNRSEAISTLEGVLPTAEPSDQTRSMKITLAKMLLATGNEVGARTQVEEVLEQDPRQPSALKMKAVWQIEADDTDSAIGGLRTALDQNTRDPEAMTLIANAYTRAGQPELAKDFLAQAVVVSGNAPAETLRYARLLIQEERYLPAEDILLAALRIDSGNIEILTMLGELYVMMEDFGRVRGVIGALQRNGGSAGAQAASGIEALRLRQQEGADAAISFLEELASQEEATLAQKIALVQAKLGVNDTVGGLELARKLVEENPDNEAVSMTLALAEIANDDLGPAEGIYRELLSTDPLRPNLWIELSRLQLKKGDPAAARAVVEEGLGHVPDNPDLLWAKASFVEQDGNNDAAIEIYQALYDQNSNSSVVANNLASLLSTYRSDEESLNRAWIIARRLRSADAPAFKDTYGWILHRRNNSAEALPYLEEAASGLPRDALVQYHLGQVLLALGRSEDALDQFRKTVAVAGPTDTRPQIEEARSLVQSLGNPVSVEN